MKLYVGPDEWWPVLGLTKWESDFWGIGAREFTAEEVADLKRVQSEFHAWQKKIAERFDVEDYNIPITDRFIDDSDE